MISRKNYEQVATLLYWKNHYAPITSIPVFILITQNMKIRSIFVDDASVTFYMRKSLHDTQSFALETTSSRCSMCSQCVAPSRRKLNLTSINFVLKHLSSSMRTSSPYLSRPVARLNKPPTPSSTKYVLQQRSSPRRIITLTKGPWWIWRERARRVSWLAHCIKSRDRGNSTDESSDEAP